MPIFSGNILMDVTGILMGLLICIITYFKWAFKYWERKNIPYVKPYFPYGTFGNPFNPVRSLGEQIKMNYDEGKGKGNKHMGLFFLSAPMYLPIDLEYIKNIMSSDFDYFMDRGLYYNEIDDPLSAHLFSIEGAQWRNLRVKLTPTFTSGKIKIMFPTLVECGNQLNEAMGVICSENQPVDIKNIAACFTTDVIGSCAFGLECSSFKEPNSEFRYYGKRVVQPSKLEVLKGVLPFAYPNFAKYLKMRLLQNDVSNFFMGVIKSAVEFREKNNYQRKDFLQLLINLKNDGEGQGLTVEQLAAQAFVFFIAGYETSSTTMTFCLFELALNQDIQRKLREEIEEVLEKHGGEITYEAIAEMKYMDQVIDETLRKYPPVAVLNRICVKDYESPDGKFILEKGTFIVLPVLGLHYDERYFPNPQVFDPERFNETNKKLVKRFTYLPFGEGPRICIGLRFGLMQTKVGLAVLLKNYIFKLSEKTEPVIKMNPNNFFTSALQNILLDVEKI